MSFEKRPVIEKIMLLRYGNLEAPRMAYPIKTINAVAKYLGLTYTKVKNLIEKHYYIPRNGKKPIEKLKDVLTSDDYLRNKFNLTVKERTAEFNRKYNKTIKENRCKPVTVNDVLQLYKQ